MKTIVRICAMAAAAALCLITACDRHQPYRPNNPSGTVNPGGGNNPGGGGSTTVKAKLMTNWTIQYKGREDYTEDNGYISRVEHFHVEAPGAAYYLVRTINPEVFQNNYGTDVLQFFKDEQGYLEQDAEYFNENVTDYLYTSDKTELLFDRIRHGSWKAFVIGFDASGKITGEYATCNFTSREDTPTAAFNRWLGKWMISGQDPDGKLVSYNIEIVSSEANFAYFVYDWETGESIDSNDGTQMNGSEDWFETFFEPSNGNMYFMSQYIQSYKEDNVNYDQFFFGNIVVNGHIVVDGQLIKNGEYIIPEENLDIAAAQMTDLENRLATVNGCAVTAYMTDTDQVGYDTEFTSMQYFADNGDEILKFNLNVPQFPLTMAKTADSAPHAAARAIARTPVTKQALRHHTQLRDVERKDARKTQHAVARMAAGTVK